MNQPFYAYLDDFDEITILVPKSEYRPSTTYSLYGDNEVIELNILEVINLGDEEKLITGFDAYIKLSSIYTVKDSRGCEAELYDGKIVRTPLFDSIYSYHKNDLGARYTKQSTKFKVWAPTAKRIEIELVLKNGETIRADLTYKNQGVWRLEAFGDFEGAKYRYHVLMNGKTKVCTDPYAISSNANSEYNYVVDESKFYKMKYESNRPKNILDSIIYETSFRDFTSYFKNDSKRSTYLSFFEDHKEGKSEFGLKYLKQLGVTHIQILPFYAFGGVDENDRFKMYNWGYNPLEYNVPSGLYTTRPNDPYARINELRKCIDMIHKEGLNVVMDVVYNHVYNPDTFPFEVLCPGYYYQYNREGIRTAFSGCKNDVNSAKKMVKKFIMDSIMYWTNEFHIDGFRFDLMGILDIETMNEISQDLSDIDPSILIYGEGWKMLSGNASDSMAHMYNRNVVRSIGFFNDRTREAIRHFSKGNFDEIYRLKETLRGSVVKRYLFKYAAQSINYVECHDDMTLYDFMKQDNETMTEDEIKDRCLLATSMNILSLGMPFIHAGEEFFGTKGGNRNSYNTTDKMNMVDWGRMIENKKYVDFIKKVIKIRKTYNEFKYNTETDITNNVVISSLEDKSALLYELKGKNNLLMIFKNSKDESIFDLSGYDVLLSNLDIDNNTIKGIGLMILKEKKK